MQVFPSKLYPTNKSRRILINHLEIFRIKIPATTHFWLGFCGNMYGRLHHVAQFCAHDAKCAKSAQIFSDKTLIINLLVFSKIFCQSAQFQQRTPVSPLE
jgi:hypothetical protein